MVSDGRIKVQTDATGLRPVYFSRIQHPPVVASHADLAARASGAVSSYAADRGFLNAQNLRCPPGRETGYNGIVALTPNVELDLETRATTRIFPRRPDLSDFEPLSVAEVVASAREHVASLAEQRGQLLLSLSAGKDSRASLAILRPWAEELLAFTYDVTYKEKSRANRFDVVAAAQVASKAGVRHKVLPIPKMESESTFLDVLKRNRKWGHSASVARAYSEQLPDGLHFRSNGYAVLGDHYRSTGQSAAETLDASEMAAIASRRKAQAPFVVDIFREFVDGTQFPVVGAGVLDPLRLFYWEYRLGVWATSIVAESDIAHETCFLLNSRRLIAGSMLDAANRGSTSPQIDIVREAWPDLLEVDVNGTHVDSEGS
ncbi:hypothetical protein GCM10022261_08930 [Brevibacterium daeguense]|uniref:Asparagine synthetase domain-containing protein n=2 Tax=Brevibacterium daeguense TaxID=909936 RepID=A0ABP8EHF6_9MICO